MNTTLRWILVWLGISLLGSGLLVTLDTILLHSIDIPNEPSGGLLDSILYNLTWVMKAIIGFIAIAFLVAFLVAEGISRVLPVRLRTLAMAVAGLCAIPVLFWAMKQAFFGVDILAGARNTIGYIIQAIGTGAVSGALFGYLTRRRRRSRYAID